LDFDIKKVPKEEMRTIYKRWWKENETAHIVMMKEVEKMSRTMAELRLPLWVVYTWLKSLVVELESDELSGYPADRRYLLDQFVECMVEQAREVKKNAGTEDAFDEYRRQPFDPVKNRSIEFG